MNEWDSNEKRKWRGEIGTGHSECLVWLLIEMKDKMRTTEALLQSDQWGNRVRRVLQRSGSSEDVKV